MSSVQGNYNGFNFQGTVISDRPQDVTFILDFLCRSFGVPPLAGNVPPIYPAEIPSEATQLLIKDLITELLRVSKGGTTSFNEKQTSNVGSNYVQLDALSCYKITFINNSNRVIEVIKNSLGVSALVLSGQYVTIEGITNANQLSIRRQDQNNQQLTIKYILNS